MKTLVVVGNDKLGRRFIHTLLSGNYPNLEIVMDGQKLWPRVFKLLKKHRLSSRTLLKMSWAEFIRQDGPAPNLPKVTSSAEIVDYATKIGATRIFLFRVGIIIKAEVLLRGVPIYNTHCADIIKYGGLGSIDKALINGDFVQRAVVHKVTAQIDVGNELATRAYTLSSKQSYSQNEDMAYNTGISLLIEVLGGL